MFKGAIETGWKGIGTGLEGLKEVAGSQMENVKGIVTEVAIALAEESEEDGSGPSGVPPPSSTKDTPTNSIDLIKEKLSRVEFTKTLSAGQSTSRRASSAQTPTEPQIPTVVCEEPLLMDEPSVPPLSPRSPRPPTPAPTLEVPGGGMTGEDASEDRSSMDASIGDVLNDLSLEDDRAEKALEEYQSITAELLAQVESQKAENMESQSAYAAAILSIEEREEVVLGLQRQIGAMQEEVTDTERQVSTWRERYVQAEQTEKMLRRNLDDLLSKQYDNQARETRSPTDGTEGSRGLASQLEAVEAELEAEKRNNEHLRAAMVELKSREALSSEMSEEQSTQHAQQINALNQQIVLFQNLEKKIEELEGANDSISSKLKDRECQITVLTEERNLVKEKEMKYEKKISDLESATRSLLDKLTLFKVNEDDFLSRSAIRDKIEKVLAGSQMSSDEPLTPQQRWSVQVILADNIGLEDWERRLWLGVTDVPPGDSSPTRGLGDQFLSFLESDLERSAPAPPPPSLPRAYTPPQL